MGVQHQDIASTKNSTRLLLAALLAIVCPLGEAFAQSEAPAGTEPAAETSPADTSAAEPENASAGSASDESAQQETETPVAAPAPTRPAKRAQTPSGAEAKTLEESGLSNPHGRDKYKHPLLFAPEDNGLGLASPQVRWELLNGSRIYLSGLKIDSRSIRFNLDQIKRADASWRFRDSDRKGYWVTNISFDWPLIMTRSGTVSFESRDGKTLWSQNVNKDDVSKWKDRLNNPPSPQVKQHAQSEWGVVDIDPAQFAFLVKKGPVRYCLEDKRSEDNRLKLCSGLFAVRVFKGGVLKVAPVKDPEEPNVWVGDKAVGPRGYVNFPPSETVHLRVRFADGGSIEVASQPTQIKLLDVVASKSGRAIILTGAGTKPLGRVKIISRPETHFWSATGIKQESVWQIAIPKERPTVRVLGEFNLPFTMLFQFDEVPKESDRVYIQERQKDTYSSSPTLYGYAGEGNQVSSSETSAKNTGPSLFEWDFGAPVKGEDNRSRLKIKERDGKTWIAHHTLYRGYPYEASARLTGVITSDAQMVLLGELAGSAWFETLGVTDNDWLALQRWGLTARYFRSLSSIDLGDGQAITEFTVLNADLKYNLVRGLWNRDELFGLIASAQQVNLSGISANLAGGGAYWARTMPKVFDDLFNFLPFLQYPKYVDMEFIYYPVSLSSGVTAGVSYNLNFHGKVFWSRGFFGEAGFGLKRFEYTDAASESAVAFSTAYGTIGIGLQF